MKVIFLIISSLLMNSIMGKTSDKNFNYIFYKGLSGYNCFRIPAIVKAKNGDLLAFAEARRNSCSDTGDIDLVMRKSSDSGATWGALQLIWDDGENVCGNPAPVVEQESGAIFLLLTWNLGSDHEKEIIDRKSIDTRRVFVSKSNDHGETWSSPKEITETTKQDNWTWYATGPVHGIQLTKSAAYQGRLIIPCDHIEAGTKQYYSHIIYSDDRGKSWKLGGSTKQHQVNECTVAELSNGVLLLNMRNYDRNHKNRKVAVSNDGGMSWSDIWSDDMLIEPICQGSLLGNHQKNQTEIFFSNPASKEARMNMTMRLSYDGGKSWNEQVVVHEGPSAYSDMVLIDEEKIGILYEGGEKSPYEGISFEVYSRDEFKK